MSRFHCVCCLIAITASVLALSGCSGEPETTVASAPPANSPATSNPPKQASEEPDEPAEPASAGYGSEEFGGEQPSRTAGSGGEGYGYGSSYGGEDMYPDEDEGYGGEGGGMYGNAGYGGGSNITASNMGGSDNAGYAGSDAMGYGEGDMGYGEGDMGYGEGMYGSGMAGAGGNMGYGGGMYGSGMTGAGGNDAGAGMAIQFIRQNCGNCHGQRQQKGGLRLDLLTANFEDFANVQLWNAAVEQMESGAMPPPEQQRRPDPAQQQAVITFVRSAIEASGLDSIDYLAEAKYAFGSGKEAQALDLLYAHVLTEGDEATQEILSKTGWFDKGLRPATTLRFAAGVVLDAPETLTDVKPIGTLASGGAGGGGYGGMGMESMGRGGGGAGQNTGRRAFDALTGDFGASLVAEFQTRWANGDMGTVFNEVVATEPRQGAAAGPGGMAGMGMAGGSGGAAGSILMDEGEGYGGGSDMGGYGASEGYGGGGYGGAGAGYGGEESAGTSGVESLRNDIMPGQIITPGLVYIGVGSQAELLERATAQGVDGLFVFNVDASENRRLGRVQNNTRLRCVLPDGEALGATATLLNTEVERKKARTGDDEVEENIDRLFKLLGDDLKLTPLPPLQPQHAKHRVRQLLTQRESLPEDEESRMDLRVMFETRLFQSMGLLSDEEAATVYQIVLRGNEGLVLVQGKPDDRRLVLDELLAQSE